MLADLPILSMITFSPLLGVLILLFIPKENGRILRTIGIAATFIPLILVTWLFTRFNQSTGGFQFAEQLRWIRIPLNKESIQGATSFMLRFDYHLAIDGLSLPLVFLTALVTAMAAMASVYIKKRWKLFYILFLLLETGMFGVFMARDLVLFFLFFEATLIPVFFLIGIWGYMKREQAAVRFLIYNGIGSALMLISFLILIATAGFTGDETGTIFQYSGDIQGIMHNLFDNPQAYSSMANSPFFLSEGMKTGLFFMLLVAFGIKLPLFPFHTWMLKVHREAPPSVVMIHSGILLKMGAYGLIRFVFLMLPEQAKHWSSLIAILGLINLVYGAILAFKQKDFKLVLAYSSISQMGIVLLGLAAFNETGITGAIFQSVSHGLISALLFLLVGSIYERTETTELDRLGGLASSIPFISGILLVAGFASLGLPGLSGFVGELLAFLGLFESMKILAVIGTLGILLAAVYMLRAVLKITFGPADANRPVYRDARLAEAAPMIVLVAFILLLGLYPGILSHTLDKTVEGFSQHIQTIVTKAGE
ncbi:MAG: NADH-quinone oxidoreductase subunit M [Gorillibacterium sp.]|nr:NADH-quinone oxidoreductase subunit M [Gorillibacterium sp.]